MKEKLTPEVIRQRLEEYFYKQREDPSVPPDVIIVETKKTFSCTFKGRPTMMTGYGGCKLGIKLGAVSKLSKVQYNGEIPNEEELEKFLERFR